MSSPEFSSSRCRICLQEGATYPIFNGSTMEASIHSQINKCFMETIEDEEGFPRNICSTCKLTLDMLCDFIDKYRENCAILKDSLVKVKTEVDFSFDNGDEDYLDDFIWDSSEYMDIKVENNNENISYNSEILGRLKLPGLKITKIKPLKFNNKEVSNTTVKKKKKRVKPRKAKIKKPPKKRETVHERVRKLIEIEEKEVKCKEKHSLLCDICGQSFNAQHKLTKHIERYHSNTKFTCPICSKEYSSKHNLKRHKFTVHSDQKFTCEHCKKEYKTKKILKGHIDVIHNNKNKNKIFACNLCSKTYKCALSLTIHKRSVHTGLRPAVCKVCDKGFFHEVYLKEHMRLHTGETPFKCPFCDRGCTIRGNMKSHLRTHKKSELTNDILSKMKPSYFKYLKDC